MSNNINDHTGRATGEQSERPLWHLLSGDSATDETGEHSLGACGQKVTDGHSATTTLDKVECLPCLREEILNYIRVCRKIERLITGDDRAEMTAEAPHAV